MITLDNGDKWIIDDSEYEGIDYEEACKGNIPATSVKDFVEQLCEAYRHDNDFEGDKHIESLTPCKLTDAFPEGYWDCNFDVFAEVFGSAAEIEIVNPWSNVYRMPWGKVIVVFKQVDCGGYDAETAVKVYDRYEDYLNAIMYGD